MKYDTILVLDFGGQYCHLIGRRIRENGVYSEIVAHDIAPNEINTLNEKLNVKGIVLSGGPSSVYEPDAPRLDPRILEMNLPILGFLLEIPKKYVYTPEKIFIPSLLSPKEQNRKR